MTVNIIYDDFKTINYLNFPVVTSDQIKDLIERLGALRRYL